MFRAVMYIQEFPEVIYGISCSKILLIKHNIKEWFQKCHQSCRILHGFLCCSRRLGKFIAHFLSQSLAIFVILRCFPVFCINTQLLQIVTKHERITSVGLQEPFKNCSCVIFYDHRSVHSSFLSIFKCKLLKRLAFLKISLFTFFFCL